MWNVKLQAKERRAGNGLRRVYWRVDNIELDNGQFLVGKLWERDGPASSKK